MDINQKLLKNIFHDYDIDKVYQRNAIDYHAMNAEHTEILGQFLDKTEFNVEDVKEILILGYLTRIAKDSFNKAIQDTIAHIENKKIRRFFKIYGKIN